MGRSDQLTPEQRNAIACDVIAARADRTCWKVLERKYDRTRMNLWRYVQEARGRNGPARLTDDQWSKVHSILKRVDPAADAVRAAFDCTLMAFVGARCPQYDSKETRQLYQDAIEANRALLAFAHGVSSNEVESQPLWSAVKTLAHEKTLLTAPAPLGETVRDLQFLLGRLTPVLDRALTHLDDKNRPGRTSHEGLASRGLVFGLATLFKTYTGKEPKASAAGDFVELVEVMRQAGGARPNATENPGERTKQLVREWRKKERPLR